MYAPTHQPQWENNSASSASRTLSQQATFCRRREPCMVDETSSSDPTAFVNDSYVAVDGDEGYLESDDYAEDADAARRLNLAAA